MIWDGWDTTCYHGDLSIENGVIVKSTRPAAHAVSWKGCCAIPGFTDSHVHLVNYAMAQTYLNLEGKTLEQIQKRVEDAVKSAPFGTWIRGRGWEASAREQGGFPDRMEIDALTPGNPVVLSSKDGHTLWLNSRALQELGIPNDISDPTGGRYDRRRDGMLTGVVRENAVDYIRTLIPVIPDDEKRRLIRLAVPWLHSQGIVAVHTFEGLREIDLLSQISDEDDLPLHVTASFNQEDLDEAIDRGMETGHLYGQIQIGGLKLFADGALGSRTASVTHPYTGEPWNYGIEVLSLEEMRNAAVKAARHNLSTAVHAIGDRAVGNAINALLPARKMQPKMQGFRLEHVQLIQPGDLQKMADHRICASVQPCHMIADIGMVERFWTEQTGFLYPYASMIRSGVMIVFGTDAPIEKENPLWNIDAAVMRRRRGLVSSEQSWHADECVDIVNAFRAATSNPAYLENSGRRCGKLQPGYPADIVILDRNPFDSGTRPGDLQIMGVYIAGHQVA